MSDVTTYTATQVLRVSVVDWIVLWVVSAVLLSLIGLAFYKVIRFKRRNTTNDDC